ncbi:electron transport complex subunit RsxC [Vibrio algivorus]|uniref:Ion-translocating oxidoreductase complex subunit C n=1 Tax=Vibrio algivorus TaxID=1667024 RepID=A0A557P3M8_9VIBR|nr:electron transport complex subunit RsxC [Vibrio algivorus]TVO35266.1 electron transport complex subunit RsxC [Vibrio algivorus]
MLSLIEQIRHGMIWDFPGGIHPPENKIQSSTAPIVQADLPEEFVLPLKQHIGRPGDICVNVGDKVLKGQQLTQANLAFMVPVHAPSSGTVTAIEKRTIAHPSGLSDLCIVIKPDGNDTWCEKKPVANYVERDSEVLIEKIRQSGISGMGGAGFPTARKLHTGLAKTKILIINAAECEPYITADDRLMQDYAQEVIQGIQVIQHILQPEVTIIGIEDNKKEAIQALEEAAKDVDLIIRVIPTKYPSGGSKQLIKVLTGREVPSKEHSAAIGVLMQNVGTAFAIKRAIIDGEPLIERVVTLTGDSFSQKGNVLARLGTPISSLLRQFGYKAEKKHPRLIMGGPLMGFTLPHADVPITKITNCILAPNRKEIAPTGQELACIRCTACAEACPASLLPQQLQWYAKAQDYEKCEEYHLSDCIECGACAYVCPSDIPLVQYYRQAKSEIWTRNQEAKEAERAKQRFEERQKRLERDKQEREQRFKQAAEKRRSDMKQTSGDDAVAAAIARVKAKQAEAEQPAEKEVKPAVAAAIARAKAKQAAAAKAGQVEPDNSEMIKLREERKRLAREKKAQQQAEGLQVDGQQIKESTSNSTTTQESTPKNAAVAAAIARAKARKAAQQQNTNEKNSDPIAAEQANLEKSTAESDMTPAENDPKKAAVATAIARAKARKAAQQQATNETNSDPIASEQASPEKSAAESGMTPAENDPKKAAVAAAIARAKARKAVQQQNINETNSDPIASEQASPEKSAAESDMTPAENDPKKAAVAAAIARAKARKAAQQQNTNEKNSDVTASEQANPEKSAAESGMTPAENDPKKAAVAAAIARAKARKAAQQQDHPQEEITSNDDSQSSESSKDSSQKDKPDSEVTLDLLDIPVFIDKSSQEKK